MIAVRKKLPSLRDVLSLYGTIVFLIYGWAIVAFFWKLHSWLYFLSLGEILAVLSYTLASSLLESTIILAIFLLFGLILPAKWLADKFIVRGSLAILILTIWVALFTLVTLIQLPTSNDLIGFGAVAFFTIALAIVMVDRMPTFQKLLLALSDRLGIFLYLWLPLSLIGILVILLRIM